MGGPLTEEQQKLLDALLAEAVAAKDLARVKLYISKGANVLAPVTNITVEWVEGDQRGRAFGTAFRRATVSGFIMHLAVAKGSIPVMDFLLEQGADIDARTEQGSTPLLLAVMNHNTALVSYLLGKGADPFAQNKAANTPLSWAKNLDSLYDHDVRQKLIDVMVAALPEAKSVQTGDAKEEKTDIRLTQELEASKPLVFKQKQRKGERFEL